MRDNGQIVKLLLASEWFAKKAAWVSGPQHTWSRFRDKAIFANHYFFGCVKKQFFFVQTLVDYMNRRDFVSTAALFTGGAVFSPEDAMKSMIAERQIQNFLPLLWKEAAIAIASSAIAEVFISWVKSVFEESDEFKGNVVSHSQQVATPTQIQRPSSIIVTPENYILNHFEADSMTYFYHRPSNERSSVIKMRDFETNAFLGLLRHLCVQKKLAGLDLRNITFPAEANRLKSSRNSNSIECKTIGGQTLLLIANEKTTTVRYVISGCGNVENLQGKFSY